MLHMIVNDEVGELAEAVPGDRQSGGLGGRRLDAGKEYDSVNPAALKRLIANGAELKAFPQPVLEACYNATEEHLNELAAKSDLFERTEESHDAYMKELLFYTQIAENFYDNYLLSEECGTRPECEGGAVVTPRAASVARMERSEIRDLARNGTAPDYASLHPGYGSRAAPRPSFA